MPSIHSVDTYIERSRQLLEQRPTSRVSVTYGSNKDDSNFVAVKTFDPVSGLCYRIKLTQTKQLSRVLMLLGPNGVAVGDDHLRGAASLMADVEYKSVAAETASALTPVPVPAQDSTPAPKSKKKSKGKKK